MAEIRQPQKPNLKSLAPFVTIPVIIISFTAYRVCAQYSRKTTYWLLPWVIWMPTTFTLKIAALSGFFG